MSKTKEIIIFPLITGNKLTQFVKTAIDLGINKFVCNIDQIEQIKKEGGITIAPSDNANIFLTSNLNELSSKLKKGQQVTFKIKIDSNEDIDKATSIAKKGATSIIVETGNWKIIPLENLIANIHKINTNIYAQINSVNEIPTMFSVLELGVDGVVLPAENKNDIIQSLENFSDTKKTKLQFAKVTEIKNLGVGDRACIDTASILNQGEGILVGSQAKTLFLVHNESSGSKFTSPRPFRVNAGSIHSYILMANGKTKYLSELESGDEVLAVSSTGNTRKVLVGRIKIERRPLTLVKIEYEGGTGSILLQNAETIPFVGKNDKQIPITSLIVGDEILVKIDNFSGRHFGVAVDEFMLEK